MTWNRDWLYGVDTYETQRLRLRANAEDPRPGVDLPTDRRDDFDPATDAWPNHCAHPVPVLAGSRGTTGSPPSHLPGDPSHSAAGGVGGSSQAPPAARPFTREAA